MELRVRFCSLAILMDTGRSLSVMALQHSARPQMPTPPTTRASSRTPIWRSSMRILNTATRSFTSSRKSTRLSAVKKKRIFCSSRR